MNEFTPAPGRIAGVGRLFGVVAGIGRRRLAGILLLTMAAAAAEGAGLLILVPLLNRLGVGTAADRTPFGLEAVLVLYVAIVAAASLTVKARTLVVQRLRLSVIDGLRRDLHAALLRMEWTSFSRLRPSDITQTLTAEVARIGIAVDFLCNLAGRAVELPVLLAVAAWLSPLLTAGVVVLTLLAAVAASRLDHGTMALGRALGVANRAFQADLSDDLAGFRLVKSFGLEEERQVRMTARMEAIRDRQMAHLRATSTGRAMVQIIAATGAALGVALAVRGFGLALSDALVLALTIARMGQALMRTRESWSQVMHALPSFETVEALAAAAGAAEEPGPNASTGPRATGVAPGIALDRVTVRHADSPRPALDGISATIPPACVTAVIGPSGAGKSTLADLLMGFPIPDDGHVLVDGVALVPDRRREWRTRIGYVPQDSFLFHDSVRANLLVAAPGADEPALWEALEQAAVADVVRRLPNGLETVLGDRGDRLSGGERQRLAVARALLRRPDVLILDEATSALDADSERHLIRTLKRLSGRVTVVLIAHRPALAQMADHVLVLDDGRLAGSGPWGEINDSAKSLLASLAMAPHPLAGGEEDDGPAVPGTATRPKG